VFPNIFKELCWIILNLFINNGLLLLIRVINRFGFFESTSQQSSTFTFLFLRVHKLQEFFFHIEWVNLEFLAQLLNLSCYTSTFKTHNHNLGLRRSQRNVSFLQESIRIEFEFLLFFLTSESERFTVNERFKISFTLNKIARVHKSYGAIVTEVAARTTTSDIITISGLSLSWKRRPVKLDIFSVSLSEERIKLRLNLDEHVFNWAVTINIE